MLNFKIIEKQEIGFTNRTRMVNSIILKIVKLPTEQEMKEVAISIWENGNKTWKEFTVFIYLPEMDSKLNAYGIVEFNQKGLTKFDINENSLLFTKWKITK